MGAQASTPFGRLLRAHRVAAGLSQERLAERAGLSLRGISDLERGARRAPRLETVRMLCAALNLGQEECVPLFRAAQAMGDDEESEKSGLALDVPTRLPVPPTPLVGRAQELVEIADLLRAASPRLITLTGAGGSGKTRLAVEAATVASPAFPDGVGFVALASIMDPTLVVSAITQALGVRDVVGVPIEAELRRFLGDKRLLLVLDNFEHLLPAAPVVADLLAACPHLTVLATSRTPLRLRGERQMFVPPLGVPERERVDTVENVAKTAAVRLFVARAQDVRPQFELMEDNAGMVAEICRRLDGLPLALELAAGRVKALTAAALLDRLERRLPLLTSGARDLPDRQRTLRDTIAWSDDLLAPAEQTLFRRLAVFVGGWTLAAAEAVVGPGHTGDVLEGLTSLVDTSLIQVAEEIGGEPRYLMLETVREFALEQLAGQDESEALRRRHADYCLALVETRDGRLEDAEQDIWRASLDADQGNMRAALGWLRDRGLARDGLRLATGLSRFWIIRRTLEEGRAWLETFLALPTSEEIPAAARSAALRWAGEMADAQGAHDVALAHFAESLALARRCGNRRLIYEALGAMAPAMLFSGGDIAGSLPLAAEAVALARQEGDPRAIASLLPQLAYALALQGDIAQADALAAEGVALTQSYGAPRGFEATVAVLVQGWVALMGEDADRAAEKFDEALRLSQRVGATPLRALALAGLAEARLWQGQTDEGAALYRQGLAQAWEDRFPMATVYNLQGVVRVAIGQGQHVRAARLAGLLETFGNLLRIIPPVVRVRYDAALAQLRRTMGEQAFTAERERGHTLAREAIMAEALGDAK
jgi:predicted ATPase/DNA-binding XRE family transcriptional regulator